MCNWLLFNRALFTKASLLQVMDCCSAMRGLFKRMSWENVRAPWLAFSTFETLDIIESIVVTSLPSTRCKIFCGIWGGFKGSIANKTINIVWCMPLHIALNCGFLLVVETSLIPRTQWRWKKAYPVKSPPVLWTTCTNLGYLASQVCSNFLAMVSVILCQEI